MLVSEIDMELVRQAFISGANNISNQQEKINELNVFPVPDGDTGTNMTLTIMSAVAEVKKLDEVTTYTLTKAVSGGSLRGARGNSGVILSQLFRGFCKEFQDKKVIEIEDIVAGFSRAVETAYKAVMKPKEGTILTVAREMAEIAAELVSTEDDFISFFEMVLKHGDEVLSKTPEMLPVLKEAGVVDSGGQGLMSILHGILSGLKGEFIEAENEGPKQLARGAGILDETPSYEAKGSGKDDISTADIKYAYCTEFIVILDRELTDDEVDGIKKYLESIGDSIVCVADEELVKIHVHTNHPGNAFEKGLEYGQLTRCKIDNMKEEHNERVSLEDEKRRAAEQDAAFKQIKLERKRQNSEEPDILEDVPENKSAEPQKYGLIAVAPGSGLVDIMLEIGVSRVVSGGQTMNPSTDDILAAINELNAENIYVFPNNKNIILAAEQAAKLSDKKVYVVPSTTVPQGIGAVINFDADAEPEDNFENMKSAMADIKSGEVTFAVRDTSIGGKEIHKGDIMAINDNGISSTGSDISEVTKALLDELIDEDSGLVSIYYGAEVSGEDAQAIGAYIEEKYEDVEAEIKFGGQPIYYYIVSVE